MRNIQYLSSICGHMQTAKAQISLRICAVWSEHSLSDNRILRYYRIYEWGAMARMILCACAGWSESAHFAHVWRYILLDAAHLSSLLEKGFLANAECKGSDQPAHPRSLTKAYTALNILGHFNEQWGSWSIRLDAQYIWDFAVRVSHTGRFYNAAAEFISHSFEKCKKGQKYKQIFCTYLTNLKAKKSAHCGKSCFYRGFRDTGYLPFYFQGIGVLVVILSGIWETVINFRDFKCFWLIVIGFKDTSTLVGHVLLSPREKEKRDRRDSRGDERVGQGRKRNRNESEETEERKTFPSTLICYKDSPIVSQYQLDAPVT